MEREVGCWQLSQLHEEDEMHAVAQWTMLIYGVFLIGGGLAGYVRAGSRISLVSGGVSGCVILLAFWLGFRSTPLAFSIGGIVAAVLMITMGIRSLRTGHVVDRIGDDVTLEDNLVATDSQNGAFRSRVGKNG